MTPQMESLDSACVSMLDMFSKFDPTAVNDSILDAAKDLCAEYLGGAWSKIDNTQIVLKKLSGGLTNLVFLCELSHDATIVACEPRRILLRIQTQSDNLQLMREIAIFMNLNAHGYGPRLLAVFPGGRIEEFIPSRNLSKEEYLSDRFLPSIAGLLAKMHALEMPLPKCPQYVPLLRSWLQRCRSHGTQPIHLERTAILDEFEFPDVVTMDQLESEFDDIEKFLSEQQSPSVFCHNDVVPSNVLLRNVDEDGPDEQPVVDPKRLVLIDFEFGFYNYRGLDISNSLAECGMTYGVDKHPHYEVNLSLMEDEKLSRIFCGAYLDQLYKDHDTPEKRERHLLTGNRDEDLKMLMFESRRFLPLQHFFWGIWNIICVQELGAIQGIDFSAHAKDRFIMYYRFKSNMYKY
ncbi:Choline/ethanolamine kinase [Trichostrongylus colubriformis]|uniref:Choline/ethanolamine kinase n=1 Tax=Trichostrongylus colubriformis TaxID=6319 RepID=A0AAN8FPA3_TRICO